jgi:hypothetical protein
MNIGVEISLYPLRNDMSTQVFGRYEDVMDALTREIRPTFERDGKGIFVMKVLGPLGQ